MAGIRETILNDLVLGLDTIESVARVTEYMLSLDNTEKNAPIISLRVESEEPVSMGSNRYLAELGLYVLTDESRMGIEEIIGDIKAYVKAASITNVLELLYIGHEDVPKEDADESRYSSVKITLSVLYKDSNNDTPVNKYPSTAPVGYMAIAKYKAYALMASGSTGFQALGTNVYDSHINANIEMPVNSGSISVDIINAPVVEYFGGRADSIHVDDNAVQISIRSHFPKGTTNTIIAPFMWSIVDQVRKNVDLGDSYMMIHDEFVPSYSQTFEESATDGAELLYFVRIAQSYDQS